MRCLLLFMSSLAAFSSWPAAAKHKDLPLEGTFRLVSATRTIVATGEVEQSFGDHPVGYIIYTRDRHMMVLMVSADRPRPDFKTITDSDRVALFNTMAAYGGSYVYDGKIVSHSIDISWNNILTGTTQIRQVRKEGDRLIYSTEASPTPTDGKISSSQLIWERVRDPKRSAK